MTKRDWQTDTSIDPMGLDTELLQQSHLVAVYSQDLAEVRGRVDDYEIKVITLEEERKQLRGNLQLDIRANPTTYNLPKVTDTTVDACLRIQDDWIKLNDNIIAVKTKQAHARLEESSLFGVLKALDHKRDAMEKLVTLLGQDYFSGPKIPHQLDKSRSDLAKYMDVQSDAKIADNLKKPKKEKTKRRTK